MALSTTAQYPGAIPSTIPDYLQTDDVDTAEKEHDLYHNRLKNEIIALATELGINSSGPFTNVLARLDDVDASIRRVVNVVEMGMTNTDVVGDAGANTFIFALLEAASVGYTDFWFPAGNYRTQGLGIAKSGNRLVGPHGGATIKMDSTGNCVQFYGSDAGGGYGTRLFYVGILGIALYNMSTSTNIGIRIKHVTGASFAEMHVTGFRGDGGGVYAYSFADSVFWDCTWDFCGSADGTNKAVIKLTAVVDGAETPRWGVDSIRFMYNRFENNSDRIADFREANGFYINKIFFVITKFENSINTANGLNGSNDANQAQFWLQNCGQIVFIGVDFTLQDKSVAWTLQTIFRMVGTTDLHLSNVMFNFGAGTMPKCFTNFVVASAATALLVLTDVWVNSGNATAFPTKVLAATNSPRLAQKNVGFTPINGGAKVATDWYTAAEWGSGGVIA